MSRISQNLRFFIIFVLIFGWIFSGWPQIGNFPPRIQKAQAATYTETFSTAGNFTWIAPIGVTTSTVETWGAGGGGSIGNAGGGGGGGGAYAASTVNVTAGTGYAITVGAGGAIDTVTSGNNSTFATTTVVADGGAGTNGNTGGAAGLASNSTGDVTFNGGAGGVGHTTGDVGGGGGGAGGPDGAGVTAAGAGANAPSAGGNGDNGSGGAGGAAGTTNTDTCSTSEGQPGTSNILGGGGGGGAGGDASGTCSGGSGGSPGGGGGSSEDSSPINQVGGDGQVKITYTIWTILGNGADPGNATIGPGGSATEVDAFTLQTSTSTDTITAVTVTLATNTTSSIAEVAITNDAGSTIYGSSTNPTSDSFSITLNQNTLTANATQTQYKIRITPKSHTNMPSPPGATYAVTGTITAWSGTNAQTGSDTGSATITIDNLSPSNVTNATSTPGDTQITVNWTNPSDTDYATTTVFRATSTIGSLRPTEGTAYATGTAITATTTVACVVGGAAGANVGCTNTGLTNGTTYYYKIFAADAYANYSTPGAETNTTPAAASTVSCNTDNASVSFGTLSTGSISTASPNASTTMSCSYANGCTLNISDAGNGASPGLATTSPAYLIPSATATLSAGTEGYGIQSATTGTGSGATLGLNPIYNKSGNDVGGLFLTTTVLASSTATFTDREVIITHKAAISNLTNTANYNDTITYSCVGN